MTDTKDIKALRDMFENLTARQEKCSLFYIQSLRITSGGYANEKIDDMWLGFKLAASPEGGRTVGELAIESNRLFDENKQLREQLEVERQRAAGSEEELHKALHREKAAERKLLAAQEEIAKHKGEQVPVALVDERQGSGGFWLTQHGRRLNLQHGTELFTDEQKPVVPDALREDILRCVDDSMHGCNSLSAPDYAVRVAGWLSASGIVKDGE